MRIYLQSWVRHGILGIIIFISMFFVFSSLMITLMIMMIMTMMNCFNEMDDRRKCFRPYLGSEQLSEAFIIGNLRHTVNSPLRHPPWRGVWALKLKFFTKSNSKSKRGLLKWPYYFWAKQTNYLYVCAKDLMQSGRI